jgi:putative lipoprotein
MMRKNRNTKSFKALLLIALGMGLLSACCAPGVRKAPAAAPVEDTSAVQEDKTLKKEDISNENAMIDTVYGDWHVRVDTVGSKAKVKNSDEFVNKLVVTISKGGKVLFDKKVFTREDIWKGADEELQVYAALPPDFTNTSVYLPVSICYPETDEGFAFLLALSKDGSSKVYPAPMGWEESDRITDFYVKYIHEWQQKPVDKASLLKLARDYGSPKFVEQLTKGGVDVVFPAKVLARKNMKVVPEAELVKGECLVRFSTSYDNIWPFDSIRVELKKRQIKNDNFYEYLIDKVIH